MAARATLEATRSACRHGSRCSVVEESGTCGNGTGRMKNCTEPRGRAIQGRDVTVWTGTKAVGRPRVKHAPKPDLMQARNPNLDFFLILALSRFAASSSPKDRSRSDLGPDSGLDTVGPEPPGAEHSQRFARPIAPGTPSSMGRKDLNRASADARIARSDTARTRESHGWQLGLTRSPALIPAFRAVLLPPLRSATFHGHPHRHLRPHVRGEDDRASTARPRCPRAWPKRPRREACAGYPLRGCCDRDAYRRARRGKVRARRDRSAPTRRSRARGSVTRRD